MICEGIGDAYFETGSEGIHWAFQKDTRESDEEWKYENLIFLENGQHLTIYDQEMFDQTDGKEKVVVWEGTVDFEQTSHLETNKHGFQGQAILGCWCHGLQRTRCLEQWCLYFFRNFPMKLTCPESSGNSVGE